MAAAVAIPLAILCCLGSAGVASLMVGAIAWLSGLKVAAILGAVVTGCILAYGLLRRRKARLRNSAQ